MQGQGRNENLTADLQVDICKSLACLYVRMAKMDQYIILLSLFFTSLCQTSLYGTSCQHDRDGHNVAFLSLLLHAFPVQIKD